MKTLLIATSIFFAGSSFGGIIYTNLGPGDTYGNGVTAECSDCAFSEGAMFTATNTGNLTQVLVPLWDQTGFVTFELFSDSGGQPGTSIETWSDVAVPTSYSGLVTLASPARPLLTAGDVYWFLAISPEDPGAEFGWDVSSVVTAGGIWSSESITDLTEMYQPYGSSVAPFAIELDTAPEPATLALPGCGLLGLAARIRHVRSRIYRVPGKS